MIGFTSDMYLFSFLSSKIIFLNCWEIESRCSHILGKYPHSVYSLPNNSKKIKATFFCVDVGKSTHLCFLFLGKSLHITISRSQYDYQVERAG